jgi:hypothetical protein
LVYSPSAESVDGDNYDQRIAGGRFQSECSVSYTKR